MVRGSVGGETGKGSWRSHTLETYIGGILTVWLSRSWQNGRERGLAELSVLLVGWSELIQAVLWRFWGSSGMPH